jgi:hypothetical protein
MTNLYAEWKKLRDNVQSASVSLYLGKNENTERKYEEALERLGQFEKENGIPLMADETEVKKMFCPQTKEEWFCGLSTKKKAKFFKDISEKCLNCGSAIDYDEIGECPFGRCRTGLNEYEDWLKEKRDE